MTSEHFSYIALYEALAGVESTTIFPSEDQAKSAFVTASKLIEGDPSLEAIQDRFHHILGVSVQDSFVITEESDIVFSIERSTADPKDFVLMKHGKVIGHGECGPECSTCALQAHQEPQRESLRKVEERGAEQARRVFETIRDNPHVNAFDNAMRDASALIESKDNVTVQHSRAEIAGNPKGFTDMVLVVELRAIAGQQMQTGRTSKLRTHFDRIEAELRRRGLDNNGAPLDA